MSIKIYLDPLEAASTLPYLVRTITYNNSDWAANYHNLRKAHWRWFMVSKVLVKAGATVQYQAIIYKVVMQTVILYISEILLLWTQ